MKLKAPANFRRVFDLGWFQIALRDMDIRGAVGNLLGGDKAGLLPISALRCIIKFWMKLFRIKIH